jgi:hypothetical protein
MSEDKFIWYCLNPDCKKENIIEDVEEYFCCKYCGCKFWFRYYGGIK